jgi:hypothetical protein
MKYLKLFEAHRFENYHLLVVDIQEEYMIHLGDFPLNFTEFLNNNINNFSSINLLYNGAETMDGPSESEYKFWLIENGLEEDNILSLDFYDKGYAFLRTCMDSGIDEEQIIDVVKYMYKENITDSRDINVEALKDYLGGSYDEIIEFISKKEDNIWIPELMGELEWYIGKKLLVTGGGVDECLKEVELCLKALDIDYEILDEFTF